MQRRQTADAMPRRRSSILWSATCGVLMFIAALTAVLLTTEEPGTAFVGHGSSGPGASTVSGTAQTVPDTVVPDHTFSIAGSVGDLFPGKTLPLVLVISNPAKVPITVTSIATTVGAASVHCGAPLVKVTKFSGDLAVKADKTRDITVHVHLDLSAPNACQGALFPFTYSGLATGK
jgi:hypothetical protein